MPVKEHSISAVQEMMAYFSGIKETTDSLVFQFDTFASPERVYVLTGDIPKFKENLKRASNLLERINKELMNDGICVIEPIQDGQSVRKQAKATKRRKREVVQ